MAKSTWPFRILEATIDDIHRAYQSGHLTCRQLVQMYLDRIEAFDKKGPAINAIITISSRALEDADRIDAALEHLLSICADDCGPCGIYARRPSRRNQLPRTPV